MISNITPVLIVKDGAQTIAQCLQSLAQFDEVVVYLNNTSDNTKEICADFPNIKLIEGEFTNFSEMRNKAASYASNDWVLSIDADEHLDDEAIKSLHQWKPKSQDFVGQLLRHNLIMGEKMRAGQMRPLAKSRLYHRAVCHFEKPVHESLVSNNATFIALPGSILHEVTFNQLKLDLYTGFENKARRPWPIVLLGGILAFLRSYIFQIGFIDGKAGLWYSISSARYHYAKYRRR